jgi:AmmeMemoRadiSam system protein A
MTIDVDRHALLAVARAAIIANVTGQAPAPTARADSLARWAGAFVTLHRNGELRGCIGRLDADASLTETIADCARLASSADPRFPAVTADELERLRIEISILGSFEPVASVDEIEIGRHGLLVEENQHRGLLLPQVATECRWNARTFVEQTCRKAGLPLDRWPGGASLWRFEADVFSEQNVEGRVDV